MQVIRFFYLRQPVIQEAATKVEPPPNSSFPKGGRLNFLADQMQWGMLTIGECRTRAGGLFMTLQFFPEGGQGPIALMQSKIYSALPQSPAAMGNANVTFSKRVSKNAE